jgi:hypothetical protein
METTSRRTFTKQSLGSLLTFSLLETLFQADAFADSIKPITLKWLNDVNQLGQDLKGEKLKQTEWQIKIEALFGQVNLPELLQLVEFDRLTRNLKLADNGASNLRFRFQQIEGVPEKLTFGKQIFGLKEGRSVVPHGHNNMSTAFLILKGSFDGKHWDRVEDQEDHIIVRPTIDRKFTAGGCSTVSDFKDNVHWFKSQEDGAYIFNIHVLGVVGPGGTLPTGRVYVDPKGEQLSDGLIRARRIGYKEAHQIYG